MQFHEFSPFFHIENIDSSLIGSCCDVLVFGGDSDTSVIAVSISKFVVGGAGSELVGDDAIQG